MGTVAITSITNSVSHNKRVVEAVVTGSSSYATGGDTIPLATLGLRQLDRIALGSHRAGVAITDAQAQTGKTVQLAGTVLIPKIKYFDTANTEITAATNLSTVSHVVSFVGS